MTEHFRNIYEERPNIVSSNENPNHGILREAILNDLTNPRKFWVDGDVILMVTAIGAAARINKHPTQKDVFNISYVEPDLPTHYQFWVNKGTLKLVGDVLRKETWRRVSLEDAAWKQLTK